jgi:DNA (cytosine-5)-methyltransferase 1
LDAQFFGVPQRRRRIFFVGHLGDTGSAPAEVLFESEGLRGDFTESRKAQAKPSRGVEGGSGIRVGGGLR